jgi:hypothetical protein
MMKVVEWLHSEKLNGYFYAISSPFMVLVLLANLSLLTSRRCSIET